MSNCKLANCIDRDYTAKYVEEFANNEYVSEHEAETIYLIAEGVRHIPSVHPKSDKPSGKWINNTHTSGCGITFLDYECSCCHGHADAPSDYCPNCGVRLMVEPQESGETETWNGIHAQITAPKGTFDKIFNDTEEDIDDI